MNDIGDTSNEQIFKHHGRIKPSTSIHSHQPGRNSMRWNEDHQG